MVNPSELYEFVRGPMTWLALAIFLAGSAIQLHRLFRLSARKQRRLLRAAPPKKRAPATPSLGQRMTGWRTALRRSVLGRHPLLIGLTVLFHTLLFITPLFARGHQVLLYDAWRFSLPSFVEPLTDALTVAVISCAAVFLGRRLFSAPVRALSGVTDFLLLGITVAPFVTGWLAFRQIGPYPQIIIAHMLSGQLMLIALGVTKLGHMIFFFFTRLGINSEHSLAAGSRTW